MLSINRIVAGQSVPAVASRALYLSETALFSSTQTDSWERKPTSYQLYAKHFWGGREVHGGSYRSQPCMLNLIWINELKSAIHNPMNYVWITNYLSLGSGWSTGCAITVDSSTFMTNHLPALASGYSPIDSPVTHFLSSCLHSLYWSMVTCTLLWLANSCFCSLCLIIDLNPTSCSWKAQPLEELCFYLGLACFCWRTVRPALVQTHHFTSANDPEKGFGFFCYFRNFVPPTSTATSLPCPCQPHTYTSITSHSWGQEMHSLHVFAAGSRD